MSFESFFSNFLALEFFFKAFSFDCAKSLSGLVAIRDESYFLVLKDVEISPIPEK